MNVLVPAFSALSGAIVAVIVMVVGRRMDVRAEEERWKRDRRVDHYEALGAAYYQAREAIRALAMQEPGTRDAERAAAKAMQVGADWNHQVIAVWLHGSPAVTEKLNDLDKKLDASFLKARKGQYTWDQWRSERSYAEHALEEFVKAVRADLDLPLLEVRIRGELVGEVGQVPVAGSET